MRFDQPIILKNKNGVETKINSRVMLAPMAGVTDVVFRKIVRQWAPDSLICTEMISSNGLVYSKRWDAPILDQSEADQPIAYQLAASRVEVLQEAGRNIERDQKPQTIDLNMGCPVKKITGNFEGCALMKDLDHAHLLISSLVKAIDTPVTVKFRLGWDQDNMNYLEFGQMCQDAGASMITLHARTRAQGYKPGVKWDAFGDLKNALKIPVIGNGDINSVEDAIQVMTEYGTDGVMIGRGCLGKPWMLGQIDYSLKHGVPMTEMPIKEKLDIAYQHAVALAEYRGEVGAVREMRRHLTDYVHGFRGAGVFRTQLVNVNTLADVRAILDEVIKAASAELAVAV